MMTKMNPMPLRYNISNLRQLTGCLSNNSRDLSIHVTEFYNQPTIRGLRISVEHTIMGTLFACVIDASGKLITDYGNQGQFHEFTVEDILGELEKYGFYVTYNPRYNLKGTQIEYLMTINKLGYDKIRVLDVWNAPIGVKESKWYVVVFRSKAHPDWLNNAFSPSEKEFKQALVDGTAINITDICECHKYNWSWLDYVGNIDDILLDNAGDDYVSEYRRS